MRRHAEQLAERAGRYFTHPLALVVSLAICFLSGVTLHDNPNDYTTQQVIIAAFRAFSATITMFLLYFWTTVALLIVIYIFLDACNNACEICSYIYNTARIICSYIYRKYQRVQLFWK